MNNETRGCVESTDERQRSERAEFQPRMPAGSRDMRTCETAEPRGPFVKVSADLKGTQPLAAARHLVRPSAPRLQILLVAHPATSYGLNELADLPFDSASVPTSWLSAATGRWGPGARK